MGSVFKQFLQEQSLSLVGQTTVAPGATVNTASEVSKGTDVLVFIDSNVSLDYFIEFSTDGGTTWTSSVPYYFKVGRIKIPRILLKGVRSFRLKFTNTSASTATVKHYVSYGPYRPLTIGSTAKMPVNFDSLSVRPSHYDLEISRGLREGEYHYARYGFRNISTSNAVRTLWPAAQTIWSPPVANSVVTISSSSILDTVAGVGARQVLIKGLDVNGLLLEEIVSLMGTVPVTSTAIFSRINELIVVTGINAAFNNGDISASISGSLQAFMPTGYSVTQQIINHTPSDSSGSIRGLFAEISKTSGGTYPVVEITGYKVYNGVRITIFEKVLNEKASTVNIKFDCPIPLEPGSYMYATVLSSVTNTFVRVRLFQNVAELK